MKAIIFDFDGTLANTLPICFYAFQEVFKKYDKRNLSIDEIKEMFGPSETGIIKQNLKHENKNEAIEFYYEKYAEMHSELVAENLEINELIRFLKNNGVRAGIFTGKARRSLEISLEALQMSDLFDVSITGDDVEEPKPHPEGLLKALTLLGVKSDEAMLIGDSDADIRSGIQAKVYTAGVQWLPDYHGEFTIQPNSIFHTVNEFKEYLLQVL